MTRRVRRLGLLGVILALAAIGCTGQTPDTRHQTPDAATPTTEETTTTGAPPTTADEPDAGTTSTTHPPAEVPADEAEERTKAVVEAAFIDVGDFREVYGESAWEADAADAMYQWVPETARVDALWGLYEGLNDREVVLAVLPPVSLRGDPALAWGLAAHGSDEFPSVEDDDIYRVPIRPDLDAYIWSNGDYFLMAASEYSDTARTYLEQRESVREPLAVWDAGTCLMLPDDGDMPWAPFATDLVVPCEDPHNAEVIFSEQVAVAGDEYDGDAIAVQRSYVCDRAFETELGPQRDHRASLITYMPDASEWDRGDRYLACVVRLVEAGLPVTIEQPLADIDGLDWAPEVGGCFQGLGDAEEVSCSSPHTIELLGVVDLDAASYPPPDGTEFGDACAPCLEGVTPGTVAVSPFPSGLYPYAFEQGQRELRCFAVVWGEDGPTPVLGSFLDEWTILTDEGVTV